MVGVRSENKERNGKMGSVPMKSVRCQPAGAGDCREPFLTHKSLTLHHRCLAPKTGAQNLPVMLRKYEFLKQQMFLGC